MHAGEEGRLEAAHRRADETVDTIIAGRFDKVLSVPVEHGRPQMSRILILWHDFLAEPALDGLHVIVGGLSKAEEGAKLLAVPTAAAAFQRIIEPGGCRYLELFGQVIDGGQRNFFGVVRKSAFQLEELQHRGEARSPLCRVRCSQSRFSSPLRLQN